MNIIPGTSKSAEEEPLTKVFIRRWQAGERTCAVKAAGVLIMSPYPGLRSFRHELNRYFCGREQQKKDLKRFFTNRETDSSVTASRMTFVVGGSGSGKSSLTRAGLIAELDSIPIKQEWGAWYVAEMRPARTPIDQLQNALWKVLQPFIDLAFVPAEPVSTSSGSFPERSADEKLQSISEASARIRCKALQLGIDWPQGTDKKSVEQAAKRWLNRSISPSRGEISSSALFDFVDDVLRGFDVAASFGSRGGSPLLLIHIDQFEEIFRKECDANGRSALIAMLRDIHVYKPERLFAVATMRSEELHRFSEYTGMADVINTSMYLVDLVDADDIGAAIVEPAWRLANAWELPLDISSASRLAPFTVEAVEELKEAYWEAGEAIQHKADKLPLLQHFLPLVWQSAVDDWIKRHKDDSSAIFEISTHHLESVPGWKNNDMHGDTSRLGRCLNAAADRVFAEAKNEIRPILEHMNNFTPTTMARLQVEAEGILLVALCSLAQLDDAGQAVRKFVSIENMLMATGGAARLGTSEAAQEDLSKYLRNALKKFEEAGLVELLLAEENKDPDVYNVTHESLIRNWAYYKSQLDEKKRLENRLWQLASGDFKLPDNDGMRRLDKILHRDWEAANTLIQSESQETLSMLFDPQSRYSWDWAIRFLIDKNKSLEAVGEKNERTLVEKPEERLAKIRAAWRDAVAWKEWGNNWYSKVLTYAMWGAGIVVTLLCIAVVASIVATMSYRHASESAIEATKSADIANKLATEAKKFAELANASAAQATKLNDQLDFERAVGDILSTQNRTALDDRAFNWMLNKVQYDYQDMDPAQKHIVRRIIRKIDSGARTIYGGDLVVQFGMQKPLGKPESAECIKTDKYGPQRYQFSTSSAKWIAIGDQSPPLCQLAPKLCTILAGEQLLQPFFLFKNRSMRAPLDSNIFSVIGDEGLLCASKDGTWVVQLGAFDGGTYVGLQPQNTPTSQPPPIRGPLTDENFKRIGQMFLDTTYRKRLSDLKTTSVEFIRSDAFVGFKIPALGPLTDNKQTDLYLWSTTGLADPIPLQSGNGEAANGTKDCSYHMIDANLGTGPTRIQECVISPVKLDTDDKQILIYRPMDGQAACTDQNASCNNTILLKYIDSGSSRANLSYRGPKIIAAGIDGDWLLIKDMAGNNWRYLVGTKPLKDVLSQRWQDVEWKAADKPFGIDYQLPATCAEIPQCKDFLEKKEANWPGAAQ